MHASPQRPSIHSILPLVAVAHESESGRTVSSALMSVFFAMGDASEAYERKVAELLQPKPSKLVGRFYPRAWSPAPDLDRNPADRCAIKNEFRLSEEPTTLG